MTISFTPGQTVAGPDWEALFAQHGGPKSEQQRPATKDERRAIEDAGDDVDQNPIYRYYAADGSYVEARRSPNGDYQIIDYKPSQQFTQSQQQAARQEQQAPPRETVNGVPHERGTDGIWRPVQTAVGPVQPDADAVGKPTGNTRQRTEGTTTVKETEYVLPDGRREWRTQTATEPAQAADVVGKPTGNARQRNEGGQVIKEAEYVLPDGRREWRSQTAPATPNVVEVNGRQGTWQTGADGKPVFVEAQGPTSPSYTYPELKLEYGRIADELGAIYRDVYGRVGVGEGKITHEEAVRILTPVYQQAQMRVNELNSIVSTQRGVWETQVGTSNTRLNAATQMSAQAIGLLKMAEGMAPGTGGAAARAAWDTLGVQRNFAASMGGLMDTSKLPGYLQAAMEAGPGQPAPGGMPAPPGGPASPAEARPPMETPMPQPAPVPQQPQLPPGVSDTTDAGGVPREFTPSSSSAPTGYLNPAVPNITINVAGMAQPGQPQPQSGQQQGQQPGYLQAAGQQQRPSLQESQREVASDLLAAGFSEQDVDAVWQRHTGQSLFAGRQQRYGSAPPTPQPLAVAG